MKRMSLALACAFGSAFLAGQSHAQTLRQPLSVKPIAFNYDYYADEVTAESPSDQVAPAAPSVDDAAAGSAASDGSWTYSSPACGCEAPASCSTCNPCGPSCGNGCGCGLGLGLGLGCCELGDAWSLWDSRFDCETWMTMGGWVQAGYHSQSNDQFNSIPDRVNLHQAWLYFERVAQADACNADWGFRADVMYGIDADDTQAFGNPPGSWDYLNGWDRGGGYGWALPQLYGELAYGNWSIKAGHFFTLVGYEVVTAPDNFFYSHAMTMYNSEPFTHTGVLGTYTVSDDLTMYSGWTAGWDTGFDQFNDGSNYLGGFSATLTDAATLTYISTIGNFGARGDDGYAHSIVLDVAMTEKLNYVFQTDMLKVDSTGEDTLGINQYFLYSVSDCLGIGSRIEWYKADSALTGYTPHGSVAPAIGSQSYYAYTVGANIRPHANVVVRPEVRTDWSPGLGYDETYFGVDAIATF